MRILRAALAGFGAIGKVHAAAYAALPFYYGKAGWRACITKVCTAHPESAVAAADLLGGHVQAVTDLREITEDPEIDIVDIAAPNAVHAQVLESAIRHGKHIYCEKPLTSTLAEAEEIAAFLPGYRGVSQMVFQYRFNPAVLRAKQILDSGRLGKILEFRADFLHAGNARPETVIKEWKLSGGVIADLGSHVLDLVRFLLGDFESIAAVRRTAYPDRPDGKGGRIPVTSEDNLMALLRLTGGADGMVSATKLATGAEDELRIEINGSDGALKFNGMDPHHLFFYDNQLSGDPVGGFKGWTRIDCGQRYPEPGGSFPSPKSAIGWIRSHIHCLWNFLSHVNAGTPAQPDLADGIYLQRVMDSAVKSADSGRRVFLADH